MRERIAVTGVGIVSAVGDTAARTFDALAADTRGFRPVTLFDTADARATIAAEVANFSARDVAPASELADFSRTDAFALAAAHAALTQAAAPRGKLGVSLGGTTGGMFETEAALLAGPLDRLDAARARRLLSHPLDRTTERVARALGGSAVRSTICAACSSGALALVRGLGWLASGEADVVLAGGADGLCRLTFFGFDALGALDPEPCRPFDGARRGLGLGEGAGFLCLERESAARARGAEILAFLSGAATGAEAHHITHPEPSGARAAELVSAALRSAGLTPAELDHVNAHGTGTQQNDAMEARALLRALGADAERVLVCSNKGQLGHTLGASGAIEAAVTVLALARGLVPPTAGLVSPEEPRLRHVSGAPVRQPLRSALSCSFGFGGTGAVLVFEHASAAPRSVPPASSGAVVVTGLAAAGPFGELGPEDGERALSWPAARVSGPLTPPALSALEPERSRRFDPAAALLTHLAERALASSGRAGSGVGLVAGTAFGAVERSVRFVLRAAERGVRRANPAEFPHLVASAPSGNASIYLGLTGAVLGVAAQSAGAEAALGVALDWLRLGQAPAVVAGAAEGFDPIVEEVLGGRRTLSGDIPRTEGGGVLLLEPEALARARGAPILARVIGVWELAAGMPLELAAPRDSRRALVLVTALDAEQEAVVAASAWGGTARRSLVEASGFHEAASAVALGAAAALVARGAFDEVLSVTAAGGSLFFTLFRRPELPA